MSLYKLYSSHPHRLRYAVSRPTVAVLPSRVHSSGKCWEFVAGNWQESSAAGRDFPSLVWHERERTAGIEMPPSVEIDVAIDSVLSGASDEVTRMILNDRPLTDLVLLAVKAYAKSVRHEEARMARTDVTASASST